MSNSPAGDSSHTLGVVQQEFLASQVRLGVHMLGDVADSNQHEIFTVYENPANGQIAPEFAALVRTHRHRALPGRVAGQILQRLFGGERPVGSIERLFRQFGNLCRRICFEQLPGSSVCPHDACCSGRPVHEGIGRVVEHGAHDRVGMGQAFSGDEGAADDHIKEEAFGGHAERKVHGVQLRRLSHEAGKRGSD